jgi:hypothetical protein
VDFLIPGLEEQAENLRPSLRKEIGERAHYSGSRASGILSGCDGLRTGTGGVAMLNPRLLSDIPSG